MGKPDALRKAQIKPCRPFPRWPQIPEAVAQAACLALRGDGCGTPALDGLTEAGSVVRTFEKSFALAAGAPLAVALSSGGAGLHVALIAAGVTPGDEVLLSAYGWGQATTFIHSLSAAPVFCDIEPGTLGIDPQSVGARVSERTKAVIVTHVAGVPANVPGILAALQGTGVRVIEDCCQAFGARINGQHVGTIGDIGIFSLGPRKHLPCGEGGMLVTSDLQLYEAAMAASQHPDRVFFNTISPPAALFETYWPYRCHPLTAVIGHELLNYAPRWHQERDRNHLRLEATLSETDLPLSMPGGAAEGTRAWGGLALSLTATIDRKGLVAYLRDYGIPIAAGPVRVPVHRRPDVEARWGIQPPCPVAEDHCKNGELFIRDSIGWLGDQSQLVDEVAGLFKSWPGWARQ